MRTLEVLADLKNYRLVHELPASEGASSTKVLAKSANEHIICITYDVEKILRRSKKLLL